ncbi:MAG: hypothetical protein MUP22_05585, partial [Desulfobacterales bacterium]|nr:hypothetical protein [Desulfobacterales bacterium]
FPKERLIIAEWVNTTSPAQLSPATQKKLHKIAKLENHIKEWEYRIKKWTINLNDRQDGLKRIKKGSWASTSFYNLYGPGEGYLKQAFGIRARTHTNVALLEEEYYRDFLRYKIDRGENKWSYRELRKWLIPKEMAYQKRMEKRLKEMSAELESYQKYQQKNMIELEMGVISDHPR